MANKFLSNRFVKNIIWIFVFFAAIAICASIFLRIVTQHGKMQSVPDFSSMTVEQAEIAAVNAHMRVEVVDSVYVNRQQKGTVVRQVPASGSMVKNGRRIQLTINALHAKQIPMPNLVGYSFRSAKAELISRGLQVGRLMYVSDMATNNVLRQLCNNVEIAPGTLVTEESRIDLMLGLNDTENLTNVPSVIGMKYKTAIDRIYDHSLNVGHISFDNTVRNYQDSLNAFVYSQTPGSESSVVMMGRSVSIRLTLDTSKVPVTKE